MAFNFLVKSDDNDPDKIEILQIKKNKFQFGFF